MQWLGLPGIIESFLCLHGLHKGLGWDWIATIWLTHILTQCILASIPRKSRCAQEQAAIKWIMGMKAKYLDLVDVWLTLWLRRFSKSELWLFLQIIFLGEK
jgi:hypothetical protein